VITFKFVSSFLFDKLYLYKANFFFLPCVTGKPMTEVQPNHSLLVSQKKEKKKVFLFGRES